MGQRRRIERPRRRLLRQRRRNGTCRDIDLLLGKVGEGFGRQIEGLGQNLGRRVADPVGDREGAELREVAIVEHQHEGAGARSKPLDRVTMAAREVPHVARAKVHDLALVLGIDRGDAAAAFDHIGPLGRVGMPVQLAQSARLECHVHAGELLRDWKLDDRRFLRRASIEGFGGLAPEREAERWKFGSGERRRRRAKCRLRRHAHRRVSA